MKAYFADMIARPGSPVQLKAPYCSTWEFSRDRPQKETAGSLAPDCGDLRPNSMTPTHLYPFPLLHSLVTSLDPLHSASLPYLTTREGETQSKMSARAGLRLFTHTSRQSAFRAPFRTTTKETVFRRHQTTATNPATAAAQPQSIFQRLWTSEIGIKTVHFWCVDWSRCPHITHLGWFTADWMRRLL